MCFIQDYVQKMLEIQRSLIGQFEVIKPGRVRVYAKQLLLFVEYTVISIPCCSEIVHRVTILA